MFSSFLSGPFRAALPVAALVLSASPAQAAPLSGVVRTVDGPPLAGARVSAQRLEGRNAPLFRTRTNARGEFSFPDLRPGTWRLRFSHPDYATVEELLRIEDGMTPLEVRISPLTVPTAEVVDVSERALPRESAATFSNLSRQDLEERAAIKDIPILLSELPSTTFYSENGNGVGYNYFTLRGFDNRRISVMIDGVPQNDPEDHNVYWINFFDLAGSLEDIQVQRGAGAGFYGPPAIGGSVNLVTRQLSSEPFVKLELGYGSFNTMRFTGEANSGLIANHWAIYGRLSHLRSEGYRDWSWSRFWRGFLGAAWYGENSSLKLQVYGGPQKDALAYYGIPRIYNEDETLRKTNYGAETDLEVFNQLHVDLIHDWEVSPSISLKNIAFFMSGVGYFDFWGGWGDPYYFRLCSTNEEGQAVGDYPQYCLDPSDPEYAAFPEDTLIRAYVDNKQVGWLPRLTWRHELGNASGELNTGAEIRIHRSLHWGRIQAGTGLPDAVVGEADRHYYEYQGGKDILSPYVNERLHLGKVQLEANLQLVAQRYLFFGEAFEGNEFEQGYLFFNPRLGANWNVMPALSLYASAGRTSREPRLKELYDAENASYGAQPDLDAVVPETLNDYELGAHLEVPRARATVNGFFMDFRNEIVKTGGLDQFGQPYYGNADRTMHAGVELEGAVRLLPGLDLAANFTWSLNRFRRFDEYVDGLIEPISRDGNPIAGFPDLLGNARLTYRFKGALAAIDAKYVGRQYTDNSADTREDGSPAEGARLVDPYALMNLMLAYRLPASSPLDGLRFGLEVNNLLNQKVLLYGLGEDNFFPAATRNYFVRLQYER